MVVSLAQHEAKQKINKKRKAKQNNK